MDSWPQQNEFLITEFVYQCVTVKAFEGLKLITIHPTPFPKQQSLAGRGRR